MRPFLEIALYVGLCGIESVRLWRALEMLDSGKRRISGCFGMNRTVSSLPLKFVVESLSLKQRICLDSLCRVTVVASLYFLCGLIKRGSRGHHVQVGPRFASFLFRVV